MKYHFTFIFLFFVSSCLYGQMDSLNSVSDTALYLGRVDKEPSIRGSLPMHVFINHNLSIKLKDYIIDKKIKGKVIIKLVVNKEGRGTRFEIYKSLDPFIDNELVKVIEKMEWYPALVEDKPVNRRITIPIIF